MERKDFIEQVGLSAASVLIFGCMQACTKNGPYSNNSSTNSGGTSSGGNNSSKIDFTINISVSPYNTLSNSGGFYVDKSNNIIIARTLSNDFIAVSSICTHQQVTLDFEANNNRFYCSGHGSTFNLNGTVINGPASSSLKQFKTAISGSSLRIYE
jgi:cytochrome b6-f complex iron-sulfur subunit